MKEYKIIERGFWKKNAQLEDTINQLAREGWEVKSTVGDGHGNISRVILEREKYR